VLLGLDVLSGSLTAKSIVVDTLSIGSGASVTISPTTGTSNTVPEPSISILLGMGALGLLGFAWRRRVPAGSHHPPKQAQTLYSRLGGE
jgi:hypothetical protein